MIQFVEEHRGVARTLCLFRGLATAFQRASVVRLAGRHARFRIADCGLRIRVVAVANPQSAIINPQSVERERFCQYVFYRQYLRLKRYCNDLGIQVAGDVPIYVAYDSADVWSHPDLFKLTRSKKPRVRRRGAAGLFQRDGAALGQSRLRLAALGGDGLRMVDAADQAQSAAVRLRPHRPFPGL